MINLTGDDSFVIFQKPEDEKYFSEEVNGNQLKIKKTPSRNSS